MPFRLSPRLLAGLLSAAMILGGLALFTVALGRWPGTPSVTAAQADAQISAQTEAAAPRDLAAALVAPLAALRSVPTSTATALPTPSAPSTPTATPVPLILTLADDLPEVVVAGVDGAETGNAVLDWEPEGGEAVYDQVFAAARRFDTVDPATSLIDLTAAWTDGESGPVVVLTRTLPALTQLLGAPGLSVSGRESITEVVETAWGEDGALVLLPFEDLVPSLVVLAVDGQNPVDNANKFDVDAYGLIAQVFLHVQPGVDANQLALFTKKLAQTTGGTNRDAAQLTVLAMTGVTAMTRQTAYQMELYGSEWPAEVVGPELAAADITHISNEVPFVAGCKVNLAEDNFNFCSKPSYLDSLTLSGVDIIGLTGNHQNDFGYEAALDSLAFYEENGLPVYGGGIDKTAAFAPYYRTANGTRFAFLGANMYGPNFAWATDDHPGSAEYDLGILSATIRSIREQDLADVVLVELQWQESYDVSPLVDQRDNFLALSQAGADIVTGVQSHVPQAFEFEDGRLIAYGLGNLFFDQMWTQATREGMVLKHTFYEGRHLSTQILTTLLFEHGQPHWSTPAQRTSMLDRVFGASYWAD